MFELLRVKMNRNDLKRNQSYRYFEFAGGSSWQGFELSGVKRSCKVNSLFELLNLKACHHAVKKHSFFHFSPFLHFLKAKSSTECSQKTTKETKFWDPHTWLISTNYWLHCTVGRSLYVDVIDQIWFLANFDLTSVDFQFLLSSTRGRQKKNENQPRIKKLNLKLYLAGNIDICETNKEKKTSFLQRLVKNY